MKRYYAPVGKEMREADDGEYYLASDVDARIAELQSDIALRDKRIHELCDIVEIEMARRGVSAEITQPERKQPTAVTAVVSEMQGGQIVQVKLHSDETWYTGTVIKARKMWVELSDYGRPMIADEGNIAEWRPVNADASRAP